MYMAELSDNEKEVFEPLFDAIAIWAKNDTGYGEERVLLEWCAHYDEQGRVLLYIHDAVVELVGGCADGETGFNGFQTNLNEIVSLLGGSDQATIEWICQLNVDNELIAMPHLRLTSDWRGHQVVIHLLSQPPFDTEPTFRCMPDGKIKRIVRD